MFAVNAFSHVTAHGQGCAWSVDRWPPPAVHTAISIKGGSHSHQWEPESSESPRLPPGWGFGQTSKGCCAEQGTQSQLDYSGWGRNSHCAWARSFRRNSWFLSSSILKELLRPSQNLLFSIVKVTEEFRTNVNEALNTQHHTSAARPFSQHALNFCDCTHWISNKFPAEWSLHAITCTDFIEVCVLHAHSQWQKLPLWTAKLTLSRPCPWLSTTRIPNNCFRQKTTQANVPSTHSSLQLIASSPLSKGFVSALAKPTLTYNWFREYRSKHTL